MTVRILLFLLAAILVTAGAEAKAAAPTEACGPDTTLTASQIANLTTAGVVVTGKPAANRGFVPTSFMWIVEPGTAWTFPNGGTAPAIGYADGPVVLLGNSFALQALTQPNSAGEQGYILAGPTEGTGEWSPQAGQALVLWAIGDPLVGGTQTLKVRVCYTVLPVPF